MQCLEKYENETNIEWNQYLDSAADKSKYTDSKFLGGTSSMIYHWEQLVSMVQKENHIYDMVIAMRLDAIPIFDFVIVNFLISRLEPSPTEIALS